MLAFGLAAIVAVPSQSRPGVIETRFGESVAESYVGNGEAAKVAQQAPSANGLRQRAR